MGGLCHSETVGLAKRDRPAVQVRGPLEPDDRERFLEKLAHAPRTRAGARRWLSGLRNNENCSREL